MRKKHILLFLVPGALFVILAVVTLIGAAVISLDARDRDARRKLDDLVRKVQSGELHATQDTLVQIVRDSRELQDEGRQTMARFLRILSFASLCGAVLQVYLVIRLKVGGTPEAGNSQSLAAAR